MTKDWIVLFLVLVLVLVLGGRPDRHRDGRWDNGRYLGAARYVSEAFS